MGCHDTSTSPVAMVLSMGVPFCWETGRPIVASVVKQIAIMVRSRGMLSGVYGGVFLLK